MGERILIERPYIDYTKTIRAVPDADVIDREAAAQMLEAEADKVYSQRVADTIKSSTLRSAAAMIRRMGRK